MSPTVSIARFLLAVPAIAWMSFGCSSGEAEEGQRVATKKECIPEVARRLIACNEESECEKGLSRYAGYCYNTADGNQLDICRGGQYFFEQPLKELAGNDPALYGRLSERQREIIVRTGEVYCVYNSN
jgi:hypothetical protein